MKRMLGSAWLVAVGIGANASAQCGVDPAGKVLAPDGVALDRFGTSVALDGPVLAIGASGQDATGPGEGAVYVFRFDGLDWAFEAKLVPSTPPPGLSGGSGFGFSVAVDDDWLLAGAPVGVGTDGEADGLAFLYHHDGAAWSEVQVLEPDLDVPPGIFTLRFGHAVALDGGRALVAGRNLGGYVFAYELDGTIWQQEQVLSSVFASGSLIESLALEGALAVVGDFGVYVGGESLGAVSVLSHDGVEWSESPMLLASDGEDGDEFGFSLGLSQERFVVGARMCSFIPQEPGAAYVFARSNGTWVETVKLVPPDGVPGDEFGTSVAIDGDLLLVGAPWHDGGGIDVAGAAYLYRDTGNESWILQQKLVAADALPDARFGYAVALDGARAAVGAQRDDELGNAAGAGYAYTITDCPLSYCTAKPTSNGCSPKVTSSGTPSATQPLPFRIDAVEIVDGKNGLLFYGFGTAALPFQGGFLCIQPPLRRTPPQSSGGGPPPAGCSGTFGWNMNAWIQSGVDPLLVPGVAVAAQYWFRDPADPFAIGLTDALAFTIEP